MSYVTTSGYKTYYDLDDFTIPWTSPSTLVIQHGNGRNAQFWRHWPPILGTTWPVIRRDLPGHGRSEDPPESYPWTMDSLVGDLVGFLDELKLDKIHFLGESTGGMLGVAFAAKHPDRIRSLTLCASPTTIGPEGQKLFSFGYPTWQDALRALGSRGWAEALSKVGGTMGDMSPAEREWTLDQVGNISVETLVRYSELISTTDVAPLLGEIKVPTLILAPTHSAATPLAVEKEIHKAIPGSELVVIDGVGHEIYKDKAHECMTALAAFLARVERG